MRGDEGDVVGREKEGRGIGMGRESLGVDFDDIERFRRGSLWER